MLGIQHSGNGIATGTTSRLGSNPSRLLGVVSDNSAAIVIREPGDAGRSRESNKADLNNQPKNRGELPVILLFVENAQ